MPDRLCIIEAQQYLNLSKSKLYKLTSSKEIPYHKLGNWIFFYRQELDWKNRSYRPPFTVFERPDYYYNLGAVTQLGSWKKWILFMLDAVENTSAVTNNLINDILEQMDSTLNYGKSKVKWYTKDVNEAIFSQPYIKPKIIGKVLGRSSRTTLTKLMEELVAAKIITPKKDGSEVYYLNDDLIRILAG